MRPLLLVHGWGFDAAIWQPMLRLLPGGGPVFQAESGYLGAAPHWPTVPDGTLLVGHSAGVPALLSRLPPGCAGLLAINGFTRFTAADGFPGVADRVLFRMQRELEEAPGTVLRRFRARCGDDELVGAVAVERLAEGLCALRHNDARATFGGLGVPLLALAAPDDPIVTPAHARACFPASALRWSDAGGHLLPLTRPDLCAAAVLDGAGW